MFEERKKNAEDDKDDCSSNNSSVVLLVEEYEMIQEIDNSNEEELQNKLNEISVQI